MRDRVVYGAHTMSMRGPETQQAASEPATNGGTQLLPPVQSEEAVISVNSVPVPSLLTTFLTRSELVPHVLQLEKSLLVIKEHDYAKAPDRAAILQASAVLARTAETTNSNDGARTAEASCVGSRAAPHDELLNCCGELARLRRSLLRSDENVASRHLREVVSLQAALVREQQEQLYAKDRELASIRKDRDQLEARLERMERRLAVHQKRNTVASTSETDNLSTPLTPTTLTVPRRHSRAESLILSERLPRSRSSSIERSRSRLRPSSHAGTPVAQEDGGGGKRSAKKRLRIEENSVVADPPVKRVKKPPKLSALRTKLEYGGLGLSMQDFETEVPSFSTNHIDSLEKSSDDNETLPSKRSSSNEPLSNNVPCNDATNKSIVVPSWKLRLLEPLVDSPTCTDPEDISDDVFLRRHKKYEEDEKRRKRWDLQRSRSLLEHQELLKKYNKKSGAVEQVQLEKKKDKVVSFLPMIDEVEEIEVLPTVAVSAFGQPVPHLKRRDFELPWFDMEAREARENVRTTRSKARASRTSAGSSDDS